MKGSWSVNVEALAYGAVLLAAAGLRLAKPAWPLLDDEQARHALAAAVAGRLPVALLAPDASIAAVHPLYHAWTTLLFQVGGLTDGATRLLGALAGSCLVLVPWLLRRPFGLWPSLLAAATLAVAPVLVTSARAPGSGMAALLMIALALAGYLSWPEKPWANLTLGACVGVAAAGGPHAVTGLAGVAVGSLIYLGLRGRVVDALPAPPRRNWGVVLATAGVMFLVAATALGLVPSGLPAAFGAVGSWLAGWAVHPDMSGITLLGSLVLYQPFWVLLGLAGILSASSRRSAVGIWLACWALGSLAIAIIYPARQLEALIWPTAAVSILAGLPLFDLGRNLSERTGWVSRLALALAMSLVLCFAALQLLGYASGTGVLSTQVLGPASQLILAVAAVFMAGTMFILIGLGWSWQESRTVTGVVVFSLLALLGLRSIWRLNFNSWAGTGQELRSRTTATSGQTLLANSLDDIAGARRESADPVTLRVYGTMPASMLWSLRRAPVELPTNASAEAPGILLMREDEYNLRASSLGAEYRGQSLATRASWGWTGLLPPAILNWYVRGVAPLELERWILLVRSDLVVPDLPPPGSLQP